MIPIGVFVIAFIAPATTDALSCIACENSFFVIIYNPFIFFLLS